ncbi:DUF3263 domain-containing protein [Modestobacter sp. I12A-02628]|uniref:DUF3263 domain-containing protein n=1 Tax=Goekera deserti TaxID=2497753 RepID=A0A7K3WJ62_9ACTN|nr:DUF3263 domain-containing protein [Goekera deserti]MPQ98207.1 DUF3263 domain-containing protein [Goekera deserti]NDI48857.1 DUF3263 domain-containing protein [Goekera deserti]NEL56538.1 DUF3263 domain-containing protein [Goekera deserti]
MTSDPVQRPAEHAAAPSRPEASGLSARDRDVLAFERQWWRFAGAKEAAVRETFGISPTRYYQVLNAVIDRPEALAADPLVVRRLRRLRATRQRSRPGVRWASGTAATSLGDRGEARGIRP